jgi:hypothetical protein
VIFNDDAVGGLSIVGATGAGRTAFLSDAEAPDVSPDGSRIVVARTDIQRLQVVNIDGSGGTPILDAQPARRPAWSPDGARIVYHRFVSSMPLAHRLFTVASGGGGVETPESNVNGLNFAADWQPIGAVPAITGFPPQTLVAGAPGATLLVDGRGFAHRSVVRWNGANRPTTWLSPTRLTAQLSAADVAAPGNATVTVFTSPSGGGLSNPATVAIPAPPAPPPRILLGTARFSKVKWTASRVRGTLRVAGTLEAGGRVEIALLRGRRALQRQVVRLPAGSFTRTIKLAPRLLPGKLTLRIQGAGAGAVLVPVVRTITLPAPVEGVVERAYVSSLQRGPAATTLRGKDRIYATFRFAALPKGSRRITVRWIAPSGEKTPPDGRPRTRTVSAVVGNGRDELPTGVWRCELRVDGTLVAIAKVRLR